MSNNRDIFDDLIKSQLDGFEANVSMADWDAIEAKLDAKERKPILAYFIVAALVLTGLVAGVFQIIKPTEESTNTVATVTETVESSKRNTSVEQNKIVSIEDEGENVAELTPNNISPAQKNTNASNNKVATDKKLALGKEESDKLPTKKVDSEPGVSNKGGDPGFSTLSEGDTSKDVNDGEIADNTVITLPTEIITVKPEPTTKDPIIQTNSPKWEIGISASPTWANKVIGKNGPNAWKVHASFWDIADKMESASLSYQVETHVNRYLGHNFYAGLGLAYNQITESVSYNYIVDSIAIEDRVNKSLTYYYQQDPRGRTKVEYSGTNVYHFIEVPVRLGYKQELKEDKLYLRLEAGLRYMYMFDLSGKKPGVTQIEELIELNRKNSIYSKHNLGFTSSVGICYTINDKMEFTVVPYYNRTWTSIRSREEGITEKPFNYGLNLGLQRKIVFKK